MKRKLFYVIEKSVSRDNVTLDGNKSVTVYEIIDNKPKVFFSLDLVLEDNSLSSIINWLDDNGYEDKDFIFKQL